MKSRYSFDAFGKPTIARPNQDFSKTVFRNTLQNDSPYYKQTNFKVNNMEHAMNDPSSTFQENWPAKIRTHKINIRRLDVHDLKAKQQTENEIQAYRRVTYDFNGKPVLRLQEPRDRYSYYDYNAGKGVIENPVTKYMSKKKSNDRYFSASSEREKDVKNRRPVTASTANMSNKSQAKGELVRSVVSGLKSQYAKSRHSSRVHSSQRVSKSSKLEKFRLVKKMLNNEINANKALGAEVEQLSKNIYSGRQQIRSMQKGQPRRAAVN